MRDLLISGGTIVNEGRRFSGYIVVRGGVISKIEEGAMPDKSRFYGDRIDATGKIVMPGVIDAHVHFREPGLTHKGDMASESAAAVSGGVTSVLEMPNTVPQTTSRDLLEQKFDLAEGRMHTNYSFFLGATTENVEKVKLFNFSGYAGVKFFMGSSTGGMLVDGERAISALFAEFGGVVAAHCEDEGIIRADTEFYRKHSGESATTAIHPLVRSGEACYRATARAVELADKYGTNLHVCHISTARELALFDRGGGGYSVGKNAVSTSSTPVYGGVSGAGKRITAEACVPHLWFTAKDYPLLGNLIKCNPSIKSPSDREALMGALLAGKIDTVATDHAPHTREEKSREYWEAPSGIPSVQHSLPIMMELVGQDVLPLEAVVEKMCHAPARRFGIVGRGFLREGYKADIAIVDPSSAANDGREPDGAMEQGNAQRRENECGNARGQENERGWVVSPSNILYKCGWSPWEGTRFASRVVCTIVGGRVVWDGSRVAEVATGERLTFEG